MKLIDGEKLIADLRRYGHKTISVDGLEGLIDVMENVHESCKDADSISRQAAIDILDGLQIAHEQGVNGYEDYRKQMCELPPAQPEPSTEIQEILEYLDTTLHPIVSPDNWNVYAELHNMVSKLPSAQSEQKIGYWIPMHPLQADDEGAYLCSNCNTGDWDIKPTDKYCKFCGSLMQGVKKE